MIVNIEFVQEQIRKGYKFIQVFSNSNLVFDLNEKDIEPENAIVSLDNFLQYAIGKLQVKLSNRSREDKASGGVVRPLTYTISVNEDKAQQQHQQQPVAGTIPPVNTGFGIFGPQQIIDLFKEQSKIHTEALKTEYDLKFQMEKLRNEMKDGQTIVLNMLDKHLPMLLNRILPGASAPVQQTRVGITGGTDTGANSVNDAISIRESLNKLSLVDANYVQTLALIAEYATKFPNDYHAMLPQLAQIQNMQPTQ